MKILVIDNYDSFTYNLVYQIRELGFSEQMDIVRNDKFKVEDIEGEYDRIVLSPGPGIPKEAGHMMEVIKTYGATKRILGICLGHQAIGESYGASLKNLPVVLHGIQGKAKLTIPSHYLFEKVPEEIEVAHYHSWVVDSEGLPSDLQVTALNEKGMIMGLSHKKYDVCGLQFHPESILTMHGKQIMENWLNKSDSE